MAQNPTFVITMADGREMKGELYPETAPQSVGNFIALANSGFYDGLIFHRVIPGFMIQGGDPKGTGIGGPGYHIKGEFAMNGVNNPLKHTYGVLSMARSMMPDSAGSQFFIMTSDSRTSTVSTRRSARCWKAWTWRTRLSASSATCAISPLNRR